MIKTSKAACFSYIFLNTEESFVYMKVGIEECVEKKKKRKR